MTGFWFGGRSAYIEGLQAERARFNQLLREAISDAEKRSLREKLETLCVELREARGISLATRRKNVVL